MQGCVIAKWTKWLGCAYTASTLFQGLIAQFRSNLIGTAFGCCLGEAVHSALHPDSIPCALAVGNSQDRVTVSDSRALLLSLKLVLLIWFKVVGLEEYWGSRDQPAQNPSWELFHHAHPHSAPLSPTEKIILVENRGWTQEYTQLALLQGFTIIELVSSYSIYSMTDTM